MRVLHYISGVFPDIGGIERFVLNVSAAEKFQMAVLTRYVDKESQAYKSMVAAGIDVYSLDIRHLDLNSYLQYTTKLKEFFNENINEYEVVHIHSNEDPQVAKLARVAGYKKIIIHVHSRSGRGNLILKALKRITFLSNCRYADCFFACSRKIAQEVYPHKIESKAIVIKNGIETIHFKYDATVRAEKRMQYGVNDLMLCHVGRFVKVKNQDFVVDVFNEVLKHRSNAKLLLVGDGPDKNEIMNKCRELGISQNVIFVGGISNVSPFFQASDFFVFPSLNEGLGMVAIEAQASGLPVMAAKDNVPNEIKVTDLVSFIPLDDNPKVWAEYILRELGKSYVDREQYYNQVKEAGFDIESTAEQLYKCYL